ncbi:unnamed protein product, partial [Vitis vinifera]
MTTRFKKHRKKRGHVSAGHGPSQQVFLPHRQRRQALVPNSSRSFRQGILARVAADCEDRGDEWNRSLLDVVQLAETLGKAGWKSWSNNV